jgi:hypothetical protein
MRSFVLLTLLVAMLALSACATTPDPHYQQLVNFHNAEREAREARFASIAATAEGCQDDACRTTIAAFAALAQAGGGGAAATLPAYRKQYHPAWGILGAVAPAAISAAVSWRQSDNSRDVSLAQYGFLGGVVRDVVSSPALQAPSITVGGDYIPGSQHVGDAIGGDYITGHVGDAIGRDQIGGDQHVGDTVGGDQIGGDAIGGDRVDGDGNYNAGRIDSPGPFEENGDDCTGDGCQGENNVPPEPEPEPEPDGSE